MSNKLTALEVVPRSQDVMLRLDAAKSKDEILGMLPSLALQYIDFQFLFLAQVDYKKTHYTIHMIFPEDTSLEIDQKDYSIRTGMPGWVIRHRSPIAVDIRSAPDIEPTFEGYLERLGITSLLIAPLQTGKDLEGALVFATIKREGFPQSDIPTATFFGIQTAIALRDIRFYDDQKKRLSQLGMINNIAQKIISILDINELLSSAAEIIQKNFNYFDVTIFLLDEKKEFLTLVAHSGSYIDFLPHGYRQHISAGIIGWTAANNQSVLLNDVSMDERYLTYAYHNTNSELTVPISFNEEVFGVLNVEDTRINAFDEMDMVVLETLADQLGSALRNARLYDEVRRSNQKLVDLDKMKTEFLSIVSHDFRSPLSSIILAAKSLIKNNDVPGNRRGVEYLKIIEDQAMRLNYLAEEILSITRLETGQLTYNFKVVNLHRLTEDAIALVTFSHKHSLRLTIDDTVSYIKADESKVRQVIHNLVSNAVKYSPRGGNVSVSVKDYSHDRILVSVSDEGIGIPKDQRDRIFKKFGRVNCDRSRNIKGSGLGLWIANEIIQAHGGRIWFDSEPGKQTTFYFTLKKAE
jgi:signal transduction histidine kinase